MLKLYYTKALVFIISVLCFSAVQAQTFKLLKDINTLTHSNPTNATNNSTEYAVLNGKAYFAADDGVHGRELWCSDGTEAGTKLVKDINPGASGSHVSNIYTYKGKIYFFTSNDGASSKLYCSDGTAAGTTILKDSMGVTGFQPFVNTQFAVLNGILLFTASNPFANEEIWQTDGTKEGTSRLFGLNTPEYNYNYIIDNLTLFNGKLYFTRGLSPGGDLWCSDGTIAGTHKFSYTNQRFRNIEHLAASGNTLYINADNLLFKTNGDSASTKMVNNPLQYSISDIKSFKNELYCTVWASAYGGAIGLFKYNPASPDVFTLVKSTVSNVAGFTYNANDSILYFTVTISDTSKPSLWATDGSKTEKLLDDNNPFAYASTVGGKLYFSHLGNDKGIELWVSNGSAAGTKMVADINPGIYHSWPAGFTDVGNKILFAANTNTNGYELWGLTGTNAAIVKDINKTSTAPSAPQIYTHVYDTINNRLFFWAYDGIHGYEPWTTDGTQYGTSLLKDIGPGPISGDGYNSYSTDSYYQLYKLPGGVRLNNYNYFFATSPNGYVLYKTQGTPATTSIATNIGNHPGGIYPRWMAGLNKKIFTLINVGRSTAQMYAYDGVTKPVLLKDSFLISFGWGGLAGAGNYMYFFIDLNPGMELWRTDGTVKGTALVKRLYPEQDIFSPVYGYMVSNNKDLFFIANSGSGSKAPTGYDNNKNYLWKTDGTAEGTIMLKKMPVIDEQPAVNNNKVYFVGNADNSGQELWVTDGTTESVKMVKDITPGTGGSNIYGLLSFKGYLYFHADAPGNSGIWKTDGTDTGTALVFRGATNCIKGNDKLYYVVNNRIWQSDGTTSGSKIMDTTSLEGLTPNNLLFANNRLYFTATSYAYGTELYTTSEKLLPVTLLNFNGALKGNDALLQWQTANELDNNYFNVQRSTAGSTFTTVGKVQAKNGSDNNYYNFTDAGVTALGVNTIYYRLQQVDLDGKNDYSQTIKLDIATGGLLKVWPNPATNFTNVYSSISMPAAIIKVTDAAGHTLYNSKHNIPAGGGVTIPLQGYAKGVYTVTIQQQGMQKHEYKVVVE